MVQSPSWEANWLAASQETPRISRNLKVHYRTHKRPPPISILGQPNPVYIPTLHLLEIHPSTPRSPQWSLYLRFPQQDSTHPLSSPIRATCPAHLILLLLLAIYYWLPTTFASFPFNSPPVRYCLPSHFNWTLEPNEPPSVPTLHSH